MSESAEISVGGEPDWPPAPLISPLPFAPPLLEAADVRKRFGDLLALDGVSLRLEAGRVHGVLGENGAGKSTLMNVLYGLLRPDGGEVRIHGQPIRLASPRQAIAAGVGMVHQHFMLAPALSVLDNILLGDQRLGFWIDRPKQSSLLRELSQHLGLPIDPAARVADLSVGQQQRVEILKALWREARVLILDEPTAVLTPAEADQLFAAMRRLCDQGRAVVFISHKLGEVARVCDDLTVLRRGRVVWSGLAGGVSSGELARHMIGHEVSAVSLDRASSDRADSADRAAMGVGFAAGDAPSSASPSSSAPARPTLVPALLFDRVDADGLQEIDLDVCGGEILGVAGVDGNGQQELAETVLGLRRIRAGRIFLRGRDVTTLPMARRQRLGIAHIPNDRKAEGLVGAFTVAENLVLKRHATWPFARLGFMRWRRVQAVAKALAARFDVRAESPLTPVSALSGGNQQKVILARELALSEWAERTRGDAEIKNASEHRNDALSDAPPGVIVAMNPVRGLDVAAAQFVYRQLLARRSAGDAVLLISSELDELLALCDRIAVLYAGRLTLSHFPRDDAQLIGRMMMGVDRRG